MELEWYSLGTYTRSAHLFSSLEFRNVDFDANFSKSKVEAGRHTIQRDIWTIGITDFVEYKQVSCIIMISS